LSTLPIPFPNTQTGFENWYSEEREGPLDEAIYHANFMWTDGNWSCDCNRCLFLWGWDEDGDPNHDLKCNVWENRIIVTKCLVDGEEMDLELVDDEGDGKG